MKRIFSATLFVAVLGILSINAFAQSESRDDLLKQMEHKRAELAILEKQILEPSEQDRLAYNEFLQQPKTGIVRLLPREKYDLEVYKDVKPTTTIRGGGAFYSFSGNSHDYNTGEGPEVLLAWGQFGIGFSGGNYGALTNLGDVQLEQITIEHRAARFLAEYSVPNQLTDAYSEKRRFGQGVLLDGATYKSRVSAVVNSTYLLRSMNWNRSNVLLVFRVVRQDTDGSVILVWKLLKNYPMPLVAPKENLNQGMAS
jgi:hypothetical protein